MRRGLSAKPAARTPALLAEEDKENLQFAANLQVNNFNKDLPDAHLFEFLQPAPLTERDTHKDFERLSKKTNRIVKPSASNQLLRSSTLFDLLRDEIDKKFDRSDTNKNYRFPNRRRSSAELSLQSLKGAATYNLSSQNKPKPDEEKEIEHLLSRLLTLVEKTPHNSSLIGQKHSNTHKLFCQLLKNVTKEQSKPEPMRSSRVKKSRDKPAAAGLSLEHKSKTNTTAKPQTSSSRLGGKLQLKEKAETLKDSKQSQSPQFKPANPGFQSSKNLRDIARHGGFKDLVRSGSGKLLLSTIDAPERSRLPIKPKQVKKIVASSFGNSLFAASKASAARKQSPEELLPSPRGDLMASLNGSSKGKLLLSKKLAGITRLFGKTANPKAKETSRLT